MARKSAKSSSRETSAQRVTIKMRKLRGNSGLAASTILAIWRCGIQTVQSRSSIARKILLYLVSSILQNLLCDVELIPTGGENISSVALESMLATHPSILEVGVVAVTDEQWGERPKAFVTVKDGAESVQGEEVIDWAKHKSDISKFMIPREVVVVKQLPKTSTGKIKKNVLREWAKGNVDAE
jgi:acyl-CoA synthetase (AMP-forming)/AMP-acid ligase II